MSGNVVLMTVTQRKNQAQRRVMQAVKSGKAEGIILYVDMIMAISMMYEWQGWSPPPPS